MNVAPAALGGAIAVGCVTNVLADLVAASHSPVDAQLSYAHHSFIGLPSTRVDGRSRGGSAIPSRELMPSFHGPLLPRPLIGEEHASVRQLPAGPDSTALFLWAALVPGSLCGRRGNCTSVHSRNGTTPKGRSR
jgi:hypothetical protein